VEVLVALLDGKPRSLGLLADVTSFSQRRVVSAIRKMQDDFGKEAFVVEQNRVRLTEKIRLPV
jgi:hypothetical protein